MIILSLSIAISIQKTYQQCYKITDMQYLVTAGEQQIINLNDIFTDSYDSTYTIDNADATVKPRINLIRQIDHISNPIIKILAKTQDGSGYWTNKFWYLDKGEEQQLVRAQGPQGDDDRLPNYNFNKKIVGDKFQYCYDMEIYINYFPSSKDILILDCSGFAAAGQPINNYFVIYDESKDTFTTFDSKNGGNYDKVYTRQLIFNNQEQHIYRAYPIKGLEGEELSIIEVYSYQDFNYIGSIDTQSINIKLKIQDYQFKLVKIIYDGNLRVLDAGGNLLLYQPDIRDILFLYQTFTVPQFALTFDCIFQIQYVLLTINKLYYLEPLFSVETSIDLQVDSSKNYDAKFTRNFIIVQLDTKIYVYTQQELKLISTYDIPKLQKIQVDQTTDEFLTYTSDRIQRYMINSQSYMYLGNPKGKTATNPIQITQTKGANVCTAKATLSQLPLGDGKIFVKSQQPLINSKVAFENSKLEYNDIYDGPVISYQQSSSNEKVQLKFQEVLEVKNMENYTDVVFVKLVQSDFYDPEFYYLIQQYNNSERQVSIFDCYDNEELDFKQTCKILVDIVNFPFFDEFTQIWADGNNIKFALRTLPTTLSIYSYIAQKKIISTELIDYDPMADNVITQIIFSQYYLYVLKAKPKILTVYTTNQVAKILAYIKEDYLATLGLGWTPTKIFSSVDNSQFFAVLNGDYLDIFQNLHYEALRPTCIKSIQIPASATIDVQIFEFEIAITYITKDGNFEIDILNYKSPSNIIVNKKAPSFNYIIDKPIIFQSYQKNYLFIYVKDPKNEKRYFFQYKLLLDTHSLLHKAFLVQNLRSSLIVASYNDLLFYIGDDNLQHLFYIPQRTDIRAQVSINDTIYFEKIKIQIDVINPLEKLTVTQDLEVLNQQLNIQLLPNKVKWGLNSLQSTSQSKCYPLGNDWYSGQISQFKALCNQCSDTNPLNIASPIYINNPAIKFNYQTTKEQLYDIQTFDQNSVVLLYEGAFSIHSIVTNVRYRFDVTQSSFKLNNVVVNGKEIYLMQRLGNQIIIYSCDSPSSCIYQKTIKGLYNTQDAQIVGDFIILSSNNQVKAISLKDLTKDIPEKNIVIQDIKAIHITGSYYQFWVLEYNQLKIVDAQLNTDSLVILKTQQYDILEQLIDLKQLYRMNLDTFITALGISSYTYSTNKLIVNLLTVTSDVAKYGFEFQLDHNAGQSLVTSIDVAYILNAPPLSSSSYFVQITDKNIVLISFLYDDGFQNDMFVAFYDLPKNKSMKPQTYVGSFYIPKNYDKVVSTYNNGTYVFYDAANYFIFNVLIEKGPQLCLYGEIQSQKVQIVAENLVESKSIILNIGFADRSASSLWWVWVLVTLAILILIFIAIFIVVKRKNNRRGALLING